MDAHAEQRRNARKPAFRGGWSVVRTDVLPGLNGKGEYKVPPNTCFEPSLPPTLVYILGKETE